MKIALTLGSVFLVSLLVGQPPAEAPAGFDDKSNGMVDVGTGDGIVIPVEEHYGRSMSRIAWRSFSYSACEESRNKVRTAPLWGLRLRTRLMHDGASVRLSDAIGRHRREAGSAARRFERLSKADREALLEFLGSL